MPIPVIAYYGLTALGGYLIGQGYLTKWVGGSDDEWEDSDVFNARMRQIHSGILDLNNLMAQCAPLRQSNHAAELKSWKSFVTLWAAFYRDIGTKYLDPNEDIVIEAKNFAATLAKWIDAYRGLCGEVPTGLRPPSPTSQKPPGTSWGTYVLWAVGIGAGGYVLAEFLKTKYPRPTL